MKKLKILKDGDYIAMTNGKYHVKVTVSEDSGIVIDVYNWKTGELIDTYTYWNDDLEE